jgi:hypothetical protein
VPLPGMPGQQRHQPPPFLIRQIMTIQSVIHPK